MFVLASNHFRKCFSVNVGVWLRMENKFFGNYFQLIGCFEGFDSEMVWSENFHFKPFTDSHAKRERERERAQITPQTKLHSDDHRPVSSHCAIPAPIKQRSTPTPLAPHRSTPKSDDPHQRRLPIAPHRSSKDRLQRRSISPSLRDLMNFFFLGFVSFVFLYDQIWWIFFLGFVSFVFLYWWMILYICLAAEKMCATSRKSVFYVIFKNTTKYHKIFFKTFFEMQPNTWKYFPFVKIALFSGKYFTWTKHSLNS